MSAKSASFPRWLAAGLIWVLASAASCYASGASAATVLRRADLVRNPFLGTVLDFELSVVSTASGRHLRRSRYTMLTRRGDRTLVVLLQEDRAAPGTLLIADDTYWLLLPQAERPVKLDLRQVVAGELSHAGFLRLNLRLRYQPAIDAEEVVSGIPCWRLRLTPKSKTAPFGRVRYWVARNSFLPVRIEFYSISGELLKTASFTGYHDLGGGPRPALIEIEDTHRPDERATLTLSWPKGAPTSGLAFDLDDLLALRDAARRLTANDDSPTSGRQLVEALARSARARGR